ncbi:MAG: hypothetical protein QXG97_01360 [Nitrososphaerota archaeon]
MKAITVATVATFAALTFALNIWSFKIPFPLLSFLYYQIWEIPIVAAFLLYGPPLGAAVAVINTLLLLAYFPGALPTGPLYNLASVLSMFVGIYAAGKFFFRRSGRHREAIVILVSTILGIVSRVTIMTIVNWAFLRYPPPVGFMVPQETLILWLPLIGFFNATLALYTIPVGYILAKAVSSGIKIKMWNSRS